MTARILVCYGSSEGQTASIAEQIGDALAADGYDATLVHLKHPPGDLDLEAYDGVIVGASIHMGHHQRYVTEFVSDNVEALNRLPSAFFSVSLTAAGDDPESQTTARELLAELPAETGWEPDRTLAVAGALKYREYGLLKRFAMRGIAGRAGGDTDTSRDHEYTDWDDVESFALEFADELVALQEG
ncbi:flavodoxin domain-containing protein [Natrarchaeobius sp. A-rgal3]|uniref:flavodoxin domain-containing protein n=1 Tax=Natrarchaeobius versutus TaxID=1679078 RepID=UPI0035105CE9